VCDLEKRERSKHGRFASGEHSYSPLLKSDAVQMLAQSFTPQSRASQLYQLKFFLDINMLSPKEALALPDRELKACIKKAVLHKRQKGNFAAGRKVFYIVRRFLELNDREIYFNGTEKKVLLKQVPKKITREYIPTREDIYRMVDSYPNKGSLPKKRGKAIILCLWESGLRVNALCSFTYGIFKNQILGNNGAIPIKVVAERGHGVYDVAQDTKLSSYAVNYYYAFLGIEAQAALKEYFEERMKNGWKPKDSDAVFVTHGNVKEQNNKPVKPENVLELVKNAAKQIGIAPDTIWTHCLRKSFRKTLYSSGIDPDVAEALMGHKLGASRGSYFDYHDIDFVLAEYLKANFTRIGASRIRQMEKELVELREKVRPEEIEKRVQEWLASQQNVIQELKERFEGLERDFRLWREAGAVDIREGTKLAKLIGKERERSEGE